MDGKKITFFVAAVLLAAALAGAVAVSSDSSKDRSAEKAAIQEYRELLTDSELTEEDINALAEFAASDEGRAILLQQGQLGMTPAELIMLILSNEDFFVDLAHFTEDLREKDYAGMFMDLLDMNKDLEPVYEVLYEESPEYRQFVDENYALMEKIKAEGLYVEVAKMILLESKPIIVEAMKLVDDINQKDYEGLMADLPALMAKISDLYNEIKELVMNNGEEPLELVPVY